MNLSRTSCLLLFGFSLLSAIEKVSVQTSEKARVRTKGGDNIGVKAKGALFQRLGNHDKSIFTCIHILLVITSCLYF